MKSESCKKAIMEELSKLKREIEDAYHEKEIGKKEGQYPPFAIMGFEDRPRYQRFILYLIESRIRKVEMGA